MALTTVDLRVGPADGWVEAASNPASLVIKPHGVQAWFVAVTSGAAPATDLVGLPMGRGGENLRESFETGAVTGKVFLRVGGNATDSAASAGNTNKALFGIIKDV